MIDSRREARLVLQAGVGDRDSLELLLSGVQPRLLAYISTLVGRTSADDVLQDVFIQICRNLKWLRDPELFRPWAYRITSRVAFAYLKRERRYRPADEQKIPEEELAAPFNPGPQLFCDVPELLERISPASRAVLNLHYVQDLSIEETAAILEIGIGTAKSRLAYGLSCLRESLKGKKQL
jgi:RNA polymerase sigma-70 factor (ECF subfamily)